MRLELGVAGLPALEAHAVDGGDRHFLQHQAHELAQRATSFSFGVVRADNFALFREMNSEDDLVESVQELRPEVAAQRLHHLRPHLLAKGPGYVLYAIMDFIVDQYFPLVDALEDELEGLEADVEAARSEVFSARDAEFQGNLEKKQAVKRTSNPADGRSILLEATAAAGVPIKTILITIDNKEKRQKLKT